MPLCPALEDFTEAITTDGCFTRKDGTMKKRLGFLALALALTSAIVWSHPAEAGYPPCPAACDDWNFPDAAYCIYGGVTTCGIYRGAS